MSDNLNSLYCPACGNKMSKIFLPDKNIFLDVCLDGCGGIYFDNRELNKFTKKSDDITPLIQAYYNKTFNAVDETQQRICPVCNTIMTKCFFDNDKEVQIDECYCCGGKFLDYKELDKIRAANGENYAMRSENNYKSIKNIGLLSQDYSVDYNDNENNNSNELSSISSYQNLYVSYQAAKFKNSLVSSFIGALIGFVIAFLLIPFLRNFYIPLFTSGIKISYSVYILCITLLFMFVFGFINYTVSVSKFNAKYKGL